MATGRWLLLLPLLVEIVMADHETDPPNLPTPESGCKHPDTTTTPNIT